MDIMFLPKRETKEPEPVLVIMDEFTRYAWARPLHNRSAEHIADVFFKEYILRYDVPEEVISDRERSFIGEVFQQLCHQMGVQKINTTAYNPAANGANERVHATFYRLLRGMIQNNPTNWKQKLPLMVHLYNITRHRSLGMSPHQVLFGNPPRHPSLWDFSDEDYSDNVLDHRLQQMKDMHEWIHERQEIQQQQWLDEKNEGRKLPEYQQGEWVKVRRHVRGKLDPQWIGPVKVLEVIGPVNYRIQWPTEHEKMHPVVHATHMRKWKM